LKELLGESYADKHWQIALTAVMNAEGDITQPATAVEKLAAAATHRTRLTIKIPLSRPPQLSTTDEELRNAMKTLRDRNRIFGAQLTIDEILEPQEETEI
ncbi:hypothetical protein HD554DRAFT_1980198, partial [Boletus coccyginus]